MYNVITSALTTVVCVVFVERNYANMIAFTDSYEDGFVQTTSNQKQRFQSWVNTLIDPDNNAAKSGLSSANDLKQPKAETGDKMEELLLKLLGDDVEE
ncbi:hypothetical protein AGMMS50230_22410 [Spirochaetia bacterium]|nr:hypothetical protein AGMMS50230_22410 [Spirochaetia bacterium]